MLQIKQIKTGQPFGFHLLLLIMAEKWKRHLGGTFSLQVAGQTNASVPEIVPSGAPTVCSCCFFGAILGFLHVMWCSVEMTGLWNVLHHIKAKKWTTPSDLSGTEVKASTTQGISISNDWQWVAVLCMAFALSEVSSVSTLILSCFLLLNWSSVSIVCDWWYFKCNDVGILMNVLSGS